jgi:hypothetical protein
MLRKVTDDRLERQRGFIKDIKDLSLLLRFGIQGAGWRYLLLLGIRLSGYGMQR